MHRALVATAVLVAFALGALVLDQPPLSLALVAVVAGLAAAAAFAWRTRDPPRAGGMLALLAAAALAGSVLAVGVASMRYPISEPALDAQGERVMLQRHSDLGSEPRVALAHQKYHLLSGAGIALAGSLLIVTLAVQFWRSPTRANLATLVAAHALILAPPFLANARYGAIHHAWGAPAFLLLVLVGGAAALRSRRGGHYLDVDGRSLAR